MGADPIESVIEPAASVRTISQPGQILHSRGDSRQQWKRWGARLELLRVGIGSRSHLVRSDRLQDLAASPHDADMGPEELVRRASDQVGAHFPDIDPGVRNEMHRIHEAQGSHPVSGGGDPRHIDPGSEGVGAGSHRHQAGAVAQE